MSNLLSLGLDSKLNSYSKRGDVGGHEAEKEEQAFSVDYYGGGSPAEIYRKVLLEVAREKRHEANSLSAARIAPPLDNNAFGQLRAA